MNPLQATLVRIARYPGLRALAWEGRDLYASRGYAILCSTMQDPRSTQTVANFFHLGFWNKANSRLRLLDPLPYMEFAALQRRALLVITDSGGIQEETTFMGVPCLTVRENTERPITVSQGTNQLVGRDIRKLKHGVENILHDAAGITTAIYHSTRIPLWDGHAAERIAQIIVQWATI